MTRRIALLLPAWALLGSLMADPAPAQTPPPEQTAATEQTPAPEQTAATEQTGAPVQTPAPGQTPGPGQTNTPAPLPLEALGDPNTQGVAEIVNDTVISDYDVNQRVALVLVTSGIRQPTKETIAQIRNQVLTSLQDETLQLQEAADKKITINAQDIEDSIQRVADENNFTVADITATLARAGVSMATFRRQIAAQIAWNRLIEQRYGGSVSISDEEIDDALDRLREGADRPQFAVSEIFLRVDSPQDDASTRETAEQIMRQLGQGANFANLARQFSQAASAAGGGDIGWVIQGQLPDEIDGTLSQMLPGRIAGPVRSEGGYYVLLLRDRREPAGTEAVHAPVVDPNAPVPIERLLLPLPPNAPEEMQNNAMQFATTAFNSIESCADVDKIAQQEPNAIHMSLGNVNLDTLAPQIAQRIRETPPGGVVPPFASQVGLEIFVRCDERVREKVPFVIPTRDQIANQLFVQQMSVLARSYMRDLRRDAVIEVK